MSICFSTLVQTGEGGHKIIQTNFTIYEYNFKCFKQKVSQNAHKYLSDMLQQLV